MRKLNIFLLVAIFAGSNLIAQNSVSNYETVVQKQKSLPTVSCEKPVTKSSMPSAVSARENENATISKHYDGKAIKTIPNQQQHYSCFTKSNLRQNLVSQTNYEMKYTVSKSTNNDVATVTLIVDGYPPYPAGSGFQMLIDADHLLYDNFYNNVYLDDIQQSYDDSEYKIPENACANFDNPNVIVNNTASIEIPEGLYDFVILVPIPEWATTFIASIVVSNKFYTAFFDNYTFLAGYEYVFRYKEWGTFEFEPEFDAGLTNLFLPPMSANLSNQEEISVMLTNTGKQNISNIELSYKINNGIFVVEPFTGTLAPGAQALYTFNTKADFSANGIYRVDANVNYNMDMIPMNNSIFSYTRKKAPLTLPFSENFDSYLLLDMNWTIINANNDDLSWGYDDVNLGMDGNYGMVQVSAPWNDIYFCNDYLISDELIFPTAGTYHIVFNAFIFNNESFRILYGTSPNPEEMELLIDYPLEKIYYDFNTYAINFDIETPDNYYFAFHYYSHPNNGGIALDIDDIMIAQGIFEGGTPDITLKDILAPVSGCGLTESVMGAKVYNAGTAIIEQFELTYQISGQNPVTQSFNTSIGPSHSEIVYFTETADFSAIGEYSIILSATTPNEEIFSNNTMEKTVKHYENITTLPFYCDFMNEEDRNNWTPGGINGWAVNPTPAWGCYYAETNYNNIPLLSRCVTLEPNVYRFSYIYLAGWNGHTDNFYVTYGKSGTDPYSWQPVKTYYDCYTEAERIEDYIFLNITEAGEYVLAFFTIDATINFAIFTTLLEQGVMEHDFRIRDIVFPTALAPRITPKYHALGEHTIKAMVENRGKTAVESGMVDLLINDNLLTTGNFNFTELGEVKNVDLTVNFAELSIGKLSFLFDASIESGVNSAMEVIKIVSDSTFAYDHIDKNFEGHGIGVNDFGPVGLGMVFELTKSDILTSIDLGFTEMASTSNIGIAVYPFTENVFPQNPIILLEYPRTNGNNEKALTFDVPDTELAPGKYLFEARQLDLQNFSLASDNVSNGFFYLNYLDGYTISKYQGLGNLHIRPNFGASTVKITTYQAPDSHFVLYPNPAKEIVTVMRSSTGKARIEVFTAQGSLLKMYEINDAHSEINISSLPAGIYIIKLIDNKNVAMQKLVKFE